MAAWLRKAGARKPIVDGRVPMFGYRNWENGPSITIGINEPDEKLYTLALDMRSAKEFAEYVVEHFTSATATLTHGLSMNTEKTPKARADRLRRLADMIERGQVS